MCGLASVAIPMAKAFGARVITSVLTDEIAEKIKPLGADVIINSQKENVAEILKMEEENGHPILKILRPLLDLKILLFLLIEMVFFFHEK